MRTVAILLLVLALPGVAVAQFSTMRPEVDITRTRPVCIPVQRFSYPSPYQGLGGGLLRERDFDFNFRLRVIPEFSFRDEGGGGGYPLVGPYGYGGGYDYGGGYPFAAPAPYGGYSAPYGAAPYGDCPTCPRPQSALPPTGGYPGGYQRYSVWTPYRR